MPAAPFAPTALHHRLAAASDHRVDVLDPAVKTDQRVFFLLRDGRSIRNFGNGHWAEFNSKHVLLRHYRELGRDATAIRIFTNTPQPTVVLLTNTRVLWRTGTDAIFRAGSFGGWVDPGQEPGFGAALDPRVLYFIQNGGRYIRYEGGNSWAEFNSQRFLIRTYTQVSSSVTAIQIFTTVPQSTWVLLTNTQLFSRTAGQTKFTPGSLGGWIDPGSFP